MAQRTKSMLEAFQASRVQPSPPAGARPAAASPPPAPEPEAPAAEAGGGRYAQALSQIDRGPSVAEQVRAVSAHQRLRWAVVGAMVVAAFFLGFAAGETRELVQVEAAERGPDEAGLAPFQRSEESETSSATPGAAAQTATFADALYDTANRFTVIAITFNQGQDDQAWSVVDYLAEEGFRAQPVAKDDKIPVLVEAAPTRSELDEVQSALRALPGPPPQNRRNEFASAYVVSIDNYLNR